MKRREMADAASRRDSVDRRFGDMPIASMNDLQRSINDALVEYLHPDRVGTGAMIGGSMAALLRSPKLAEVVGRMVAVHFDELSLPPMVTEVAILATARHWECAFILFMHRRRAIAFGVDPTVVDTVVAGDGLDRNGEFGDVCYFTLELLQAGDVTDDSFSRVVGRWGLQGAVELISTVGFYTMLCFVLNVDRYPVPHE
jgi:4-carboxymuconolactone decarboxylase